MLVIVKLCSDLNYLYIYIYIYIYIYRDSFNKISYTILVGKLINSLDELT